MLVRLIDWSLRYRILVLLACAVLAAWGVLAARHTALDAIPDLADVQVIVKTPFPGQPPQIVEDQLTYPLTATLLSVPGARAVRGFSMFGESFIYVVFSDGTDPYWARSRVLEYLSQMAGRLPPGVTPTLGPDASSVGWVFQYALVDRSGKHDNFELRALQDFFLKVELQSLPGVAEVASIGGAARQFQIEIDPNRLAAYGLDFERVAEAVRAANQAGGGSVLEMGRAEYMVRAASYLKGIDDLRQVRVGLDARGYPLRLGQVAQIHAGPEARRGVTDLDGEGEAPGGIVVMRHGQNALDTVSAVKARLRELQSGLPAGVEIVATYDRSNLILRAIDHLREKLVEESLAVALVCLVFLLHWRSALVALVTLPLGMLAAFIVIQAQGITVNLMSLGGIAIAIGAMVDAAIVMIENAHKHIERAPPDAPRLQLMINACREVGPALFFSLLIITVSFLPVFTLEAQEGRMFQPLAYTKTFSMAGAALLSITLVPVLMLLFVRGKIMPERKNPVNRFLIWIYRPVIALVMRAKIVTIVLALLMLGVTIYPLTRLGSEFMPALNEGTLLYMPASLPGMSVTKAAEVMQTQNRIIKSFPEVASVFGKAGRANSATDPAPLEMFETVINLKPEEEWRPGMTTDKLIAELDQAVQMPGVSNAWTMPIKARTDMLSTGIRTPIGIKVFGKDLGEMEKLAKEIEAVVKQVPGTTSAYAERITGGFYLMIEPDRQALARYGLAIGELQEVIGSALGGETVTTTVEGRERFGVITRYPRELRDDLATTLSTLRARLGE